MKAFLIILLVLSALAALYVFVLVRPRKTELDSWFKRPYAHRGLYGGDIPENSLTAFRLAAEAGYGIELDLQLSRDGEVMVFHDYSLERMTGCTKKLSYLTSYELKALSLNGTEEKIPTLSEVLSVVDGRVPILVELKGENLSTSLCPSASAILQSYSGKYIVESFNPILLRRYKKICPEIPRGILITNVCREKGVNPLNLALSSMCLNFLSRPSFIAYDLRLRGFFPVKLCTDLYKAGRFVWTIRTEEDYKIAESQNATPIFEQIRPEI